MERDYDKEGKPHPSHMDVDQIREEVNTRNVLAAIGYTQETRAMMDAQAAQIEILTNEVATLRGEVQNLTVQVGILRGEVYGGGPTA